MAPESRDAASVGGEPGRLAGKQLGPYPVSGLIGAGGMGEVYRAHDPRLGRDVAIKVLPAHLSQDAETLARFEREVRAVAALSHPNILAIHDVGTDEGLAYAVMELLDGQTLRAHLGGAPLPWRRALAIATQVADGLAAAHARNIVHRDLKPDNIFITASGPVKILDFGLARVAGDAARSDGVTVGAATQPGAVMGTVGYMSPEQARGEESGPTSDVFAFGCVLYEMLTGRAPFARPTGAESMAAVLRDDPVPLAEQVADLPPAVEAVVAHCLEKRPSDRFQSAKDMGFALRAVAEMTGRMTATTLPAVAVGVGRRRQRRWSAVAAGVLAGLAIGTATASIWWYLRIPAATPAPLVRASLVLSPEGPLAANDSPSAGSSVAISQDGRLIAYVVQRSGVRHLAVRALERDEERLLRGTEGALFPVFSPDAQWVAFFTETGLKKVSLSGGTPTTVCWAPPVPRGAVWADDGAIYFSPEFSTGLQRVPSTGGQPSEVTRVDLGAGESNHLLPEALPGARALLFTVWKGGDFGAASIWSVSLPSGERRLLLDAAAAPRYLQPGFLVFARGGALFAARFDVDRLAVTSEALPVIDGVWSDRLTGTAHYAVARNGTLVYASGGNTVEERHLVWVDRQGRAQRLGVDPGYYANPRLSPDGRHVVLDSLNDIWTYSLENRTLSRLTFRSVNQFAVWHPDGRHLAFSSSDGVAYPKLFWTDIESGGRPEALTTEGGVQFPASWTPDGRALAYAETAAERTEADTGWDIWLLRRSSDPPRSVLIRTPFTEDQPAFSPDGRALAYVSNETGQLEVYVRTFPDTSRRARVSTDGGTEPVWARGGGELFYRRGRGYFSVPVTVGDSIRLGRPSLLFEGDYVLASEIPGNPSYDVAPDGQRFVMVARASETPQPRRLELVLGWAHELERRLSGSTAP